MTETFSERTYSADGGETTYVGYQTNGVNMVWNGYESPLFEHSVAEKILQDLVASTDGAKMEYVPETDSFRFFDPEEESWEEWKGRDIIEKSTSAVVRVYGIGAGSWCWVTAPRLSFEELEDKLYRPDEKRVDGLNQRRQHLLQSLHALDNEICLVVRAMRSAAFFVRPRALDLVLAEIETKCEGRWMEAARYHLLPVEIKAMIVLSPYLVELENGCVRDDEEGIMTYADLKDVYVAEVQKKKEGS